MIEQLPGVMDSTRVFLSLATVGGLIGTAVTVRTIFKNWDKGGNYSFLVLLYCLIGIASGSFLFGLGTVALPSEPTLFIQPGGRVLLYKPTDACGQCILAWNCGKIAPESGVVILPCREETRKVRRTINEATLSPGGAKSTREIVWRCSILLDDVPTHVLARHHLLKVAERDFGETWEDAIFAGVLCWSGDRDKLTDPNDPDQVAFLTSEIEKAITEECEDAQGTRLVAGSVKFQIF